MTFSDIILAMLFLRPLVELIGAVLAIIVFVTLICLLVEIADKIHKKRGN